MNELTQTILVLLIVASCAAYVVWQFVRTIRAANGQLGACCAKGCEAPADPASTPARPREHFIASDTLARSVKLRSK